MFKERTECVLSHEKKWKPTRKSPSHVIIIPGDTFPVLSLHLRFLLPQARQKEQKKGSKLKRTGRRNELGSMCL